MLLLHGYLSNKESFFYQLSALEKGGFCAVVPDMPAFGASHKLERAWSVGDYADWLKAFMEKEGVCGAHIIAHSFGARVALKLFSSRPDLADKIIITGGAGIVKPRSPQYMRQVKRYRRIKKLLPKYAEKHFGSDEYKTLSPIMKESYKLIVNEDLKACAQKIKSDVLLIYGRDDTVTPPAEEGKIFNGLIGKSQLKIIDGGHFCFCENYKVFNSLALEFLKG